MWIEHEDSHWSMLGQDPRSPPVPEPVRNPGYRRLQILGPRSSVHLSGPRDLGSTGEPASARSAHDVMMSEETPIPRRME